MKGQHPGPVDMRLWGRGTSANNHRRGAPGGRRRAWVGAGGREGQKAKCCLGAWGWKHWSFSLSQRGPGCLWGPHISPLPLCVRHHVGSEDTAIKEHGPEWQPHVAARSKEWPYLQTQTPGQSCWVIVHGSGLRSQSPVSCWERWTVSKTAEVGQECWRRGRGPLRIIQRNLLLLEMHRDHIS